MGKSSVDYGGLTVMNGDLRSGTVAENYGKSPSYIHEYTVYCNKMGLCNGYNKMDPCQNFHYRMLGLGAHYKPSKTYVFIVLRDVAIEFCKPARSTKKNNL